MSPGKSRNDDDDVSGGHTPPPVHRAPSETNIHIPIEIILDGMKRDIARDFKDIKKDLATIEASQQESRYHGLKQDNQIETIAVDVARTNKHLDHVDNRVVELERTARDVQTLDNAAAKGWVSQAVSGLVNGFGYLIAVGIGALIVWGLGHYFHEVKP